LVSNGSSAPTWVTPSAGAMTLLNTLTASSSATLSDTTSITSSYDLYMFAFDSLIPATNAVSFYIQYSTNGGSSWLTSSYYFTSGNGLNNTLNSSNFNFNGNGSAVIIGGGIDAAILNTPAGYGLCGVSYLNNPLATTFRKCTYGNGAYFIQNSSFGATYLSHYTHSGAYDANNAINAVRFLFSSGNITSGKIRIYGIKTS
jgi:hypothetical protein